MVKSRLLEAVGIVAVVGWIGLIVAALSFGSLDAQQHRYLVTAEPLRLDLPTNPLCIAVDAADPRGVWWWEPGTAGCRNRRTSDILHGDRATVVRAASSGRIEIGFRMTLHSLTRPFVDIALVVDEKGMGPPTSDIRVPIEERRDLDIPSSSGR
jgi:hypothetical protein